MSKKMSEGDKKLANLNRRVKRANKVLLNEDERLKEIFKIRSKVLRDYLIFEMMSYVGEFDIHNRSVKELSIVTRFSERKIHDLLSVKWISSRFQEESFRKELDRIEKLRGDV